MLAVMLAAPLELEVSGEGVVEDEVAAGIRMRGGEFEGFHVVVRGTSVRGTYEIEIADPSGTRHERVVVLEADTDDGRSRELAADLVLVLEEMDVAPTTSPITDADEPVEPPPPPPDPPRTDPIGRGFVVAWPRFGIGDPTDPDFGIGLAAGLGVLGKPHASRLQPRLQFSWARAGEADLTLDTLRFGAGLAVGGAVHRHVWLGALAVPQAAWNSAREGKVDTSFRFSCEGSGLLHVSVSRFVLEARVGAEFNTPAVTFSGAASQLRVGYVRFLAALGVGVRI
jgi:hypothetical protein